MTRRQTPLEVGDYLPMFQAFDEKAILNIIWNQIQGKPILIAFCSDLDAPAGQSFFRDLSRAYADLKDRCQVFAVSAYSVERNAQVASMLQLGFPLLCDEDHRIAGLYGMLETAGPAHASANGAAGHLFVSDPNRQIAGVLRYDQGGLDADLRDLVASLTKDDWTVTAIHAPVLYLPRALDPGLCADLIELHETGGNSPSGIGRDGVSGRYFDAEKKVRTDHKIRDAEMVKRLSDAMQGRVIPEVHKAFNFQITRLEEFKIGRYDASDRGHFYPHRDNVGLGYRRFAMSVNLNAGEYEGGYLRFPEYGPSRYRPGTGDGVIFSCSLLHEATPITRGARYVLLGFFFDEEANRIRQTRPLRRQ